MFSTPSALRIAIYGSEVSTPGRGVGLWSIGYKGAVIAAGATPVFVRQAAGAVGRDRRDGPAEPSL